MEFHCEDLSQYGVFLVPPSSPEYSQLAADIQRRLENSVEGSPPLPDSMGPRILEQDRETSAILLNRSQHGIAALQQFWTFEDETGRTSSLSSGNSNSFILRPFGVPEKLLTLYRYWQVILPGSKRYLSNHGELVGDNSDVRPPRPDERWTGGVIGAGSGRGHPRGPLRKASLTLDGVFFDDGGFAGPDREGLWDRVVLDVEAHAKLARMAREGRDDGTSPENIFAALETVTGPASDRPPGPPPPPPPIPLRTPETYRESTKRIGASVLRRLAWHIARVRRTHGDERALEMLTAWAAASLPNFRKL